MLGMAVLLSFAIEGPAILHGQQVDYYAAIWDQSTVPAWVGRHRMTESDYQAAFNDYASQGYRLRQVSGYAINGVDYYAAVWDKAPTPGWVARHRMTAADYQAAFDLYLSQGYRLVWVNGYAIGDSDYYAAIWEQGSGPAWVARHRMTATDYQAAFDLYLSQGYRLLEVSGYTINGTDYYAAIWDQSTVPAWVGRHRMTESDYQAAFNDYASQGYRLRQVSGYAINGVDYYAAVWDKAPTPGWVARHRMTAAAYQAAFDLYLGQGYRLVAVDGYSVNTDPSPVPDIPASGVPVLALQAFDDFMKRFMGARGIPAAALCVSRNGTILLERAYGWQDQARLIPLRPSAMFRIASLCKPITASAIQALIAQGQLSPDAHAFNLGQAGGGILAITPFVTPDPRLASVTVAHLLAHTGGWDRGLSGDPMFESISIASALAIPGPPGPEDIARYMMGRPLDHAPGTTYSYSNFGYMLLGLILQQVSGSNYADYIHSQLFSPLGVAATEIELGHTLAAQRNPREPWYSDPGIGPSVFSPSQNVLSPDGSFYLEAMEAHGGLISTSEAYARFLNAYWIDGSPRAGNGQDWTFLGSLPGTFTLGRQRPDGVNIVAFFNQRSDSSWLPYEDIQAQMDAAAMSITSWPSQDITRILPSQPRLSFNLAANRLSFVSEEGRIYQAQKSADLHTWFNLGAPFVGDGYPMQVVPDLNGTPSPGSGFYRLMIE